MPAWIQHMGRARAKAKKARLTFALQKMDEYLAPPERGGIAGNAGRESTKQRLVLLVSAGMSEQDRQGPGPETRKFLRQTSREPRSQP